MSMYLLISYGRHLGWWIDFGFLAQVSLELAYESKLASSSWQSYPVPL